VQGTDGNFYGTTDGGGTATICTGGCGTLFKISPAGELTILHQFCSVTNCADGSAASALTQATDGDFYGTTRSFGANRNGTVFKIDAQGDFTTLYAFCAQANCADGQNPSAGVMQADDGNFYGTTEGGGSNDVGTVFKITSTGGVLTTLYSFCAQANCPDGEEPVAELIQATDGKLYSTAEGGGTGKSGTIFSLTLSGALAVLHDFGGGVGSGGALLQATNGSLYGLAQQASPSYGFVYSLTPSTSTTALATSGSPSTVGQLVTFTATVTSKGGAIPDGELVTFYDGPTALASVPLSSGTGSYATSSLSVKTHTIKAAYAGDTWIRPSSKTLTQVVEAFASTTTLTSSPNPSTSGQAVVLTATVTSAAPGGPTGKVTFKNGTTSLGTKTLSSGSAALSTTKLPVGTLTLSVTYDGDAESAKSSGTTTQTVQ
jgi:uncharacterized repeat protein (TIGR03803 family)